MDATEWYESETMRRAIEGDAEAGRDALRCVVSAIDARRFDSPLFPFLADRLLQYLDDGLPLARALCVEGKSAGGRRRTHDPMVLAAVDILLRDHAGYGPEQANTWLGKVAKVDRRQVQRIRAEHDARYSKHGAARLMESLKRDHLLYLSGKLRKAVAGVLPEEPRKNEDGVLPQN